MGYKTRLKKLKNVKIIPTISSDHSGIKIEISNDKKMGKFVDMWKLNNTLLETTGSMRKSKGSLKCILKMKTQHNKT